MTTTKLAKTLTPLAALAYLGVAVASSSGVASASTGGATPETGASPAPTPTPQVEVLTPVSATATPAPAMVVDVGALKMHASSVGMLGHTLAFVGGGPARYAGRLVAIQRLEPAQPPSTQSAWVQAATARVNSQGAFVVRWRANVLGRITVRLVLLRSSKSSPAHTTQVASSTSAQLSVYKPAVSTWFGPGFYGNQTACGQTLSTYTVGVASRTLPCGTLVEVTYAGRRLTVPVIDRGPYANGAEWDLTAGAAQALGILETVSVGTLVVGSTPNVPMLGTPPGAPAPSATGGTEAGQAPTAG